MFKYIIIYLIIGIIVDYVYVNYILKEENIDISKRIFHILFWLPGLSLYIGGSMCFNAVKEGKYIQSE
jgi:hypothetical protein